MVALWLTTWVIVRVLLLKDKHWANVLGSSQNHIDLEVNLEGMGTWRLTGNYGFPERHRRRDSWNMLRNLSQSSSLPWCCIGDYNDLLLQIEKRGRLCHPDGLLQGFREAVEDSGLQDLGMRGYPYTWEKSGGTLDWAVERLDRAMVSQAWYLKNFEASSSDHLPIFLNPRQQQRRPRQQRFQFENMWLAEPECGDVIKHSWQTSLSDTVQIRLQNCGCALVDWGRSPSVEAFSKVKQRYNNLFDLKQVYLKQISKHGFWM